MLLKRIGEIGSDTCWKDYFKYFPTIMESNRSRFNKNSCVIGLGIKCWISLKSNMQRVTIRSHVCKRLLNIIQIFIFIYSLWFLSELWLTFFLTIILLLFIYPVVCLKDCISLRNELWCYQDVMGSLWQLCSYDCNVCGAYECMCVGTQERTIEERKEERKTGKEGRITSRQSKNW